jgi:hypothetical protein
VNFCVPDGQVDRARTFSVSTTSRLVATIRTAPASAKTDKDFFISFSPFLSATFSGIKGAYTLVGRRKKEAGAPLGNWASTTGHSRMLAAKANAIINA